MIDKTSLDPITDVKNKVKNSDIFKDKIIKENFYSLSIYSLSFFCPSLRNTNSVHTNNLGALYPLIYSQTIFWFRLSSILNHIPACQNNLVNIEFNL